MTWLRTFTGKRFDPLVPRYEDICIEDIAHSLSNMCRFAGHTSRFYGVAQHSVYVSAIMGGYGMDRRAQLVGLLHDASEAYLVDVPRPVKITPQFEFYRSLEHHLEEMIYAKFVGKWGECQHEETSWDPTTNVHECSACDEEEPESEIRISVKRADVQCLAAEARDLMGDPKDWEMLATVVPYRRRIIPVSPKEAEHLFLRRFARLGG